MLLLLTLKSQIARLERRLFCIDPQLIPCVCAITDSLVIIEILLRDKQRDSCLHKCWLWLLDNVVPFINRRKARLLCIFELRFLIYNISRWSETSNELMSFEIVSFASILSVDKVLDPKIAPL